MMVVTRSSEVSKSKQHLGRRKEGRKKGGGGGRSLRSTSKEKIKVKYIMKKKRTEGLHYLFIRLQKKKGKGYYVEKDEDYFIFSN